MFFNKNKKDKKVYLTVRQYQRFVGVDTLDNAEVRCSLKGQLDAFPLQDIQELDVAHNHFINM